MLFGMFGRKQAATPGDSRGWPFQGPRNEAVITVDSIVTGDKPILLVVHDATDGRWQFLTGEHVEAHQAKVVALLSITEIDPTLLELADLPEGWCAVRQSVAAAWERGPTE